MKASSGQTRLQRTPKKLITKALSQPSFSISTSSRKNLFRTSTEVKEECVHHYPSSNIPTIVINDEESFLNRSIEEDTLVFFNQHHLYKSSSE